MGWGENRTSSLDVKCPNCGRWHSAYTQCPDCGHDTKMSACIKHSITYDLYSHQDYERSNHNWLICEICGSEYNKYEYEKCPHCRKSKSNEFKSKLVVCPKCGRKKLHGRPCSYCNYIIKCPKCGKNYNKKHKGKLVTSCPHCEKSKPITSESDLMKTCSKCGKKYKNKYDTCPHCKDKRENLIVWASILAFIIFTIIMMYLF